jgi:hypothetical protein
MTQYVTDGCTVLLPLAHTVPLSSVASSGARSTQVSSPRGSSADGVDELDFPPRPKSKFDHSSSDLSRVERPDRRRTDDDESDDDVADDVHVPAGNAAGDHNVSVLPVSEKENAMSESFSTVKSTWDAKVSAMQQEHPDWGWSKSVAAVAKQNPQLRERLVAAANQTPVVQPNAKAAVFNRVNSDFRNRVAAKRQECPRLSQSAAVAAVCKEDPALHRQLVEAANA